MPHLREFSYLLVGDHLGHLKKVHLTNKGSEIYTVPDVNQHDADNPVVSIEPMPTQEAVYYHDTIVDDATRFLVSCRAGHVYIYDSLEGSYELAGCCHRSNLAVCKALPLPNDSALVVYDKQIDLMRNNDNEQSTHIKHYCPLFSVSTEELESLQPAEDADGPVKKKLKMKRKKLWNQLEQQRSELAQQSQRSGIQATYVNLGKTSNVCIKNAIVHNDKLAVVGENIALRVYDVNTKQRTFTATAPEPDWLGVRAGIYVTGVDWLGGCESAGRSPDKLVTCSMSDSVIRLYDTRNSTNNSSTKPVLTVDLNDRTFNEYADAPKFTTIAASRSGSGQNQSVIVGSSVGQTFAVDFRFAPSKNKKKTKPFKHLGAFKGSLGACIKDITVVANRDSNKVVTCSLDRHVRVHNYTHSTLAFTSRALEKKIFVKTKPLCCAAVYADCAESDEDSDQSDRSEQSDCSDDIDGDDDDDDDESESETE